MYTKSLFQEYLSYKSSEAICQYSQRIEFIRYSRAGAKYMELIDRVQLLTRQLLVASGLRSSL